jgi:hypothetical protein
LSVVNFASLEISIKRKTTVRSADDRTIRYGNDSVESDSTLDNLLVTTGASLIAADVKASNIVHSVRAKGKKTVGKKRDEPQQSSTVHINSKKRKRNVLIEEQSFSGLLDLFKDLIPPWKKARIDSNNNQNTTQALPKNKNKSSKRKNNPKNNQKKVIQKKSSGQSSKGQSRQNSSENPYAPLYTSSIISSQVVVQRHTYGTRRQRRLNEIQIGSDLLGSISMSGGVSNYPSPSSMYSAVALTDDCMQIDEFVDDMEIVTEPANHSNIVSQHMIVA